MTASNVSTRKPDSWFPAVQAPSMSPLVELTTAVIGKLLELNISTFNHNLERNLSNLQALAKVRDLPTFMEHQQKFAQAFWQDQEQAFETALKTVREGFEEAQKLMNAPRAAAAKPAAEPETAPAVAKQKPTDIAAVRKAPVSERAVEVPKSVVKAIPPSAIFEIHIDKAGEYRFRLKAADGSMLLISEGYKTRASVMNGIASVQKNASNDARYAKQTSATGKLTFNLKAGNHQVIGTSRVFTLPQQMEAAIDQLKLAAAAAQVDDQTENV